MEFATWAIDAAHSPILATAVHAGHDLRPEVEESIVPEDGVRLREEDPFTDELATYLGSYVVVHRSRFEVDLNRPRDTAVYADADSAWGMEVWRGQLDSGIVDRSLALYDDFYRRLETVLSKLVDHHEGFVLYDIHSYNHRRPGPESSPEPEIDNPQVNLGTGTLPGRWRQVADAFLTSMGATIDVRENVKFRGRAVAAFVHEKFGDVGCALAIEFRKSFMDEWTGEVDGLALKHLAVALGETRGPVWEAQRRCR